MKKNTIFKIIFISLILSISAFAGTKNHLKEKPLIIKSQVVKMLMGGNKIYRLELYDFAAVYYAHEKIASCLHRSMKENKKVSLIVSSQSLIVRECKVE